ncbi:Phosphoribosyl transferase domain-containing protein [Succiniclasticum ruminis]|uniref:Phosphoribosyl transferase domain-containing protein n=1 Tax=Succiniclasticum ruminis TaxID=40841 RepID=A0A1G6HRT1_9FIRM|nr:phosphoribosyltransferase [Succiniclasticum ruminis]SDB96575.1 Phosphoribosyl transferase domain-containing protein [Succiniclasticum ruminis]
MAIKKGHYNEQFGFTNGEGRRVVAHMAYDYDYLVDYHPKRDGNNPLFDYNSQLILDFKNGYPDAIEHFADLIDKDFNPCWNGCYCVAVPSSNPANNYSPEQDLSEQNLSPYELLASYESKKTCVYDLIARLVGKHSGLHNGSAVLIRVKRIVPKSKGGSRAVSVDLDSIEVNSKCGIDISGKNILLIDDIITTGNSIVACKMILEKGGAKNVFVLCLGKTSRDPYVSNDSSVEVPFDEEVPF